MSAYLICICFESGVPIFARKIGDVAPIPFPLAASLNGVKVFGKSNKIELISTLTESGQVVWRDFHDKISLIYCGTSDSLDETHVQGLLQNVFNVLVLCVGVEEIRKRNSNNVEKLKREFKLCYPLIDSLLQAMVKPGEMDMAFFGDLTGVPDFYTSLAAPLVASEAPQIDPAALFHFSNYACLTKSATILACTKDWNTLSPTEIFLLSLLSNLAEDATTETCIYLPESSPNVPYKFVTCRITEDVRLCLLCSGDVDLGEIEKVCTKWKKNFVNDFPRLDQDKGAFSGYLLTSRQKKKSTFHVANQQKLEVLRLFYKNCTSIFSNDSSQETYWSSNTQKCHALRRDNLEIYVSYDESVPFLTMRQTSLKILKTLTKEKLFK